MHFHSLPKGSREEKIGTLEKLSLVESEWVDCPSDWRDPFLPAATGAWAGFPTLKEIFIYDGSGVMPERTWVIAPDADSLRAHGGLGLSQRRTIQTKRCCSIVTFVTKSRAIDTLRREFPKVCWDMKKGLRLGTANVCERVRAPGAAGHLLVSLG